MKHPTILVLFGLITLFSACGEHSVSGIGGGTTTSDTGSAGATTSTSGTGSATCTSTSGAGGSTCSYPWEFVPTEMQNAVGPDCGGQPGDPLPCGACDGSVALCKVGHNRACPGVPPGDPAIAWSPYDAWLCVCDCGSWSCKVQYAAAAICPPEGLDAGP